MMKNKGLYIHIPFCDELCPYCSFCHVLTKFAPVDKYIDRLIDDINNLNNQSFYSIYIGGGTPSVLNSYNLERLLFALSKFIKEDTSFAIEVNPSSINEEKIKIMAKYGVNRVSIGVQTFSKKLQNIIKRPSSYEEIKNIISLLNKYGIYDVNLDLMYGIPSQNIDDLKVDLDLYTSLNIKHISCYSLQIEDHTLFYNQHIEELDQDTLADFYDYICLYLKQLGFNHYEISNFALDGYESKHNLLYWRNEEYVGLGISSSGYEGNIRYTNESSLTRYINNSFTRDEEVLNLELEKEYFIILALRLKEGINLTKYKKSFNSDFLEDYKDVIDELVKQDVAIINNNHFFIKEKYFFILNQYLIKFIK